MFIFKKILSLVKLDNDASENFEFWHERLNLVIRKNNIIAEFAEFFNVFKKF